MTPRARRAAVLLTLASGACRPDPDPPPHDDPDTPTDDAETAATALTGSPSPTAESADTSTSCPPPVRPVPTPVPRARAEAIDLSVVPPEERGGAPFVRHGADGGPLGDLDGDGRDERWVRADGDPGWRTDGVRAASHLQVLWSDGARTRVTGGGRSLASLGDLDGDCLAEVLVRWDPRDPPPSGVAPPPPQALVGLRVEGAALRSGDVDLTAGLPRVTAPRTSPGAPVVAGATTDRRLWTVVPTPGDRTWQILEARPGRRPVDLDLGAGAPLAQTDRARGTGPRLDATDRDGDGVPDLALWDDGLHWWWPAPAPTPRAPDHDTPGQPVAWLDVDGDGDPELVLQDGDRVRAIAPSAPGTPRVDATRAAGAPPLVGPVGDVDGDGVTDLLAWTDTPHPLRSLQVPRRLAVEVLSGATLRPDRTTWGDDPADRLLSLSTPPHPAPGLLAIAGYPSLSRPWVRVAAGGDPDGDGRDGLFVGLPLAGHRAREEGASWWPSLADPDACDGGPCATACADGVDGDGDGRVDGADPDCLRARGEVCDDGADDDGDGLVDCADPDCALPCGVPDCHDRLDDDRDGRIDCADPDCAAACFERLCSDGRDDDGDGLMDCEDGDCALSPACGESVCDDGEDDDGDGDVDCADEDCWGPPCRAELLAWVDDGFGGAGISRFSSSILPDTSRPLVEARGVHGRLRGVETDGRTWSCGWSVDRAIVEQDGRIRRDGLRWDPACEVDPRRLLPERVRVDGSALATFGGQAWYAGPEQAPWAARWSTSGAYGGVTAVAVGFLDQGPLRLGEAQGACATGTVRAWGRDADGDGHAPERVPDCGATAAEVVHACVAPPGFVDAFGDCDDTDPAVGPRP